MAIQMKGKKAFHAAIFVFLGVFLFILFLYIGFPYETLKRRIIGELEAKTPFRYEIEEIRPHPLPGLTFKNIAVYTRVDSERVKVLGVERFRITLSILQLLWRKVYLRLWGEMLDGTVDGDFLKKGRGGKLTLEGKDVNLQHIHFLQEVKGVELAGILQGRTMIGFREGNLFGQSGTAEFQISGVVLKRLPFPGIAPLRVGQIQGNIELEHGRIILKQLTSSGVDFNGQVRGNIFLNSNLPQSRLNLKITIKPSGKFDPKYRMLLSFLGSQGKAKGVYAFSLGGTLLHPRLVAK